MARVVATTATLGPACVVGREAAIQTDIFAFALVYEMVTCMDIMLIPPFMALRSF